MGKLMEYVDVCIANEADAEDVFGIKAENTDIEKGPFLQTAISAWQNS